MDMDKLVAELEQGVKDELGPEEAPKTPKRLILQDIHIHKDHLNHEDIFEPHWFQIANLETCKEVIEVEPKELKEYEELSNTHLLVPKPISKLKEQVTSSLISCAENFQTTCLMYLSTPRELEKDIGTKEELNTTKDFLNQNQSHGETTQKLNEMATKDDESVDDTIQIKEEPSDTNFKAITKLTANYHANSSHTHTRDKYLISLIVCDFDLFYLYADNGEPIISKENKQKPWKYVIKNLLMKEKPLHVVTWKYAIKTLLIK